MELGKISRLDDIPLTAHSIQPRRRINLSISTKGVYTWDLTVEMYGDHPDDILKEVEALRQELTKRYPQPLQ